MVLNKSSSEGSFLSEDNWEMVTEQQQQQQQQEQDEEQEHNQLLFAAPAHADVPSATTPSSQGGEVTAPKIEEDADADAFEQGGEMTIEFDGDSNNKPTSETMPLMADPLVDPRIENQQEQPAATTDTTTTTTTTTTDMTTKDNNNLPSVEGSDDVNANVSTPPLNSTTTTTTPSKKKAAFDMNTFAKSFRRATKQFKHTVQEIDRQHKIQETTGSGLRELKKGTVRAGQHVTHGAQVLVDGTVKASQHVSHGARQFTQGVRRETTRATDRVSQYDVPGKTKAAARSVAQSAKAWGKQAQQLNEKYRVVETVASMAAVVGALSLARGNVRGGATSLGVAGAAYMAAEAMNHPTAAAAVRPDQGLNEDLHMD